MFNYQCYCRRHCRQCRRRRRRRRRCRRCNRFLMSQPRPEITHLFSSFGFRVLSFPLLFCHLDYGLASDFPLFLQVSFGGGEVQAASTDLLKDFEQEGVDRTELCLRLLG